MNFLRSIGLADVADIAIVAGFAYAVLVWFKRTKAFLVVVGIVILGSVYALARYFNLFLTTAMLQGFFAVLLIAVIVIFQEELRQFFERVALWGLGRRRRQEATPLAAAVVGTATDLARAKVGGLIVIAGNDPVARHVEGGIELDGKPSEALLMSIFSKGAPGHDGAAVIEDGRVTRFAAHLPLSKDLVKLSGVGTRHAAALGLAERCDAMCIVISEERGSISIACDGELIALGDTRLLGSRLDSFLKEKFPPREERRWRDFARRNLREKIIAIVLAVGLWAAFSYRTGIAQRDIAIPIEFGNLQSGLSIERAAPRELTITLSGEERAFRLLDTGSLRAMLDLSSAKEGRLKIRVGPEMISRVPHTLSLDDIRPSEVEVVLKSAGER